MKPILIFLFIPYLVFAAENSALDSMTNQANMNKNPFQALFDVDDEGTLKEKELKKIRQYRNNLLTESLKVCPIEIHCIIHALRNKHSLQYDQPKQLLMVGPPGTGKTTLATAIAAACARPYYYIHAPSLLGQWRNQTAGNLCQAINSILEKDEACIIIIDEITCLTDSYDTIGSDSFETSAALWTLLDKCNENSNIFFIGITNDSKKMPNQLKSRFLGNTVEIPLATFEARKKILRFHFLKNKNICFNKDCTWKYMFSRLKSYSNLSNREIENFVSLVKQYAFFNNRTKDQENYINISRFDFECALKKIKYEKKELLDFNGSQISVQEELHNQQMNFSRKTFMVQTIISLTGIFLPIMMNYYSQRAIGI